MAKKINKPIEEVMPAPILEEITEPSTEEATVEYVVVTADLLNVRKEASKESDVLDVVKKDVDLLLTSPKLIKGFYSIITPSGIAGYVMKEFVIKK